MAKKEFLDKENEQVIEYMRFLPETNEGLLSCALESVELFHDAVMAADKLSFDAARYSYKAAIQKMNGGTHFGLMADDDSPGNVALAHCKAVPGQIPKWGQCGDFAINVDGIRAYVKLENWMADLSTVHLSFTPVDLDSPFISGTGYRSHFANFRDGFGRSVEAFVIAEFRYLLKENKKPVMIEQQYLERLSQEVLPPWCYDLTPAPRRDSGLPPAGYVLVDCILPEYQAVIARQWAAAAEEKLKKKTNGALDKNSSEPPKSVERPAVSEKPKITVTAVNQNKFRPGQVCKVVRVHCANPALGQHKQSKLGQEVVIAKLLQSGTSVWAYDNVPARYRINQRGNRTCDYDPSCIQDLYDINDLEIVEGKEHATKSLISHEN